MYKHTHFLPEINVFRVRNVTRGCLTSATSSLAAHPRALSDVESGEVLGASRVNSYGGIKVCFRCSQLHGHSISLCDLSGIGAEYMEPQHTLLFMRFDKEV